ncbi:hypothetical protein NDU88_005879 [Pleurodeles waltl]|uniref:Uncharacterized protein n=1 Tax=Pleurodeles waltl TaxID=8319 RepID=A0AAV7VNX5_PLEWA|nr:hypothetical protein NDU88_005879 [Pleurodeles waltl]
MANSWADDMAVALARGATPAETIQNGTRFHCLLLLQSRVILNKLKKTNDARHLGTNSKWRPLFYYTSNDAHRLESNPKWRSFFS